MNIDAVKGIGLHRLRAWMKFCPIAYVFLSVSIKFYAENVEKKCIGLCEFRERRRSEYPYFTTGVD